MAENLVFNVKPKGGDLQKYAALISDIGYCATLGYGVKGGYYNGAVLTEVSGDEIQVTANGAVTECFPKLVGWIIYIPDLTIVDSREVLAKLYNLYGEHFDEGDEKDYLVKTFENVEPCKDSQFDAKEYEKIYGQREYGRLERVGRIAEALGTTKGNIFAKVPPRSISKSYWVRLTGRGRKNRDNLEALKDAIAAWGCERVFISGNTLSVTIGAKDTNEKDKEEAVEEKFKELLGELKSQEFPVKEFEY